MSHIELARVEAGVAMGDAAAHAEMSENDGIAAQLEQQVLGAARDALDGSAGDHRPEVGHHAPPQRQGADARADDRPPDRGAGQDAAQRFNFGKFGQSSGSSARASLTKSRGESDSARAVGSIPAPIERQLHPPMLWRGRPPASCESFCAEPKTRRAPFRAHVFPPPPRTEDTSEAEIEAPRRPLSGSDESCRRQRENANRYRNKARHKPRAREYSRIARAWREFAPPTSR